MYILDNNNIRQFTISTRTSQRIAGQQYVGAVDGVGTNAMFRILGSGVIDSNATYMYLADLNNYRIRRLDLLTYTVTTFSNTAGTNGCDVGSVTGGNNSILF